MRIVFQQNLFVTNGTFHVVIKYPSSFKLIEDIKTEWTQINTAWTLMLDSLIYMFPVN